MTDPASSPQSQGTGELRPELRAIYEAEFDYVWHCLRRFGVRRAELEDAAHEVFLVVHRRLSDFDPTRPLRPWLAGISFRVASDQRRRAHVRREVADANLEPPEDESKGPEALLEDQERRGLVNRALESLDLDRRAVLVLHDIDGHAMPAIAEQLEVPLNTCYSRLRLAREQFKSAVERIKAADKGGRA
jgi:RNA polymerase sigma-70 factor (ECF subfamily)